GKILVGGAFTTYNGIQRTRIARLLNCVVNRPVLLGGGNLCPGNEAVATVTSGTLPVLTSFSADFYNDPLPAGWSTALWATPDLSLGGDAGSSAVLNAKDGAHYIAIKLPSSSSRITWKMAANGTHTPSETGFNGDVSVQEYVSGTWQTISTTNYTAIHKNNPPGGDGNHTVGDVIINKDADSIRFILQNKTAGRVAIDDIQVFANWEWFTGACGGTKIGSGTSLNTYPTTTTTYYVSATAECGATACDSVTFTLPTQGVALSGSESVTCLVKGNAPIHFYTASGNYIGAINPKGKDLGNVTMTAYVSTPKMMKDCNAPANTSYHTTYMGRSWYLTSDLFASSAPFGGDVQVILPFNSGELTALNSSTLTPNNPNDNGANLSNIMLTKISGGTADGQATLDDCSGTIKGITADSSGTIIQGITTDFIAFNVTEFSEFFLHKNNGIGSPLPITLTSFAGNCNDNGVQLAWTTATETNVNHFEIYRSRNGQTWEKVIDVNAVGNSSTANTYHTTDAKGIETMYYKLRSVDNDGTYEDFNPIS
ncbi:MAG TPA: delta-60 repeat domain-containing protein, partial [Crocinitomicaceae bacterium]|nr:delta-60 repeat domain-containing protein [Crocinitomicaceae bacterium]